MSMSEENIKRFNESVHTLYNTIMDKPLQVLDIFNDFFGKDKVDMQGAMSEEELRTLLEAKHIHTYLNRSDLDMAAEDWDKYSTKSIVELPQGKFELALSALSYDHTIENITFIEFNDIFILVHFPHVRVTNEHDRYVDINHLWAKIKITSKGTMNGGFALNRSEYQAAHFMSDYMH